MAAAIKTSTALLNIMQRCRNVCFPKIETGSGRDVKRERKFHRSAPSGKSGIEVKSFFKNVFSPSVEDASRNWYDYEQPKMRPIVTFTPQNKASPTFKPHTQAAAAFPLVESLLDKPVKLNVQ